MALHSKTSEEQEDSEIHILHKPERFLGPLEEIGTKTITVRQLKALGIIKNNDDEVRKERRDLLALVLRVLNDVSNKYNEVNDNIFNEETFQDSDERWVCAKLSPLFHIHFLRRTYAPSLLLDYKARCMMQDELEELSEDEIQRLERCAERQRQSYITKCKEYYQEIFTTDRDHPMRTIDFITRTLIDFIMVPLKDERIGKDHEYVEEDYYIYMHAIRALAPYLNTCAKSEVQRFLQICNVQWVRKNCYTHEIQCVVKYWLMDRDYGVTLAHILGEMYVDSSSYFDDYMLEHILDYIIARRNRTLFNFREIRNLMVFYLCAALIRSNNDFLNTVILDNLMNLDGHESWSIAEVIYREGLIDWTWNAKFWIDYLETFELPVEGTEDILMKQCPRVMVGGRDTGSVAQKVRRMQERYDARVAWLKRRQERNMQDPSYCEQLEKKRRGAEKMKTRALEWLQEKFPVEDGEDPEEKQWTLVSQKREWKAAGCPLSGEDLTLKVYRETNCDKILLDGATRERKYEVYGPAPRLKPLSLMREPLDLDEDSVTDKEIAGFRHKSIWKRADDTVESIREAIKEEGKMIIIREGSGFDEGHEEDSYSERNMTRDPRDEGTDEALEKYIVQALMVKHREEWDDHDTASLNGAKPATEEKSGGGEVVHGINNTKEKQKDHSTEVNLKESTAERGRDPGKEEVCHMEQKIAELHQRDLTAKFSKMQGLNASKEREQSVKEKTEQGRKGSKQSKVKKRGSREEPEKRVEYESTPSVGDVLRRAGQKKSPGAEGGVKVKYNKPMDPAWKGGPSTEQLIQLLGEALNSKNLKSECFAGMDPDERNEVIQREAMYFICGYCRRMPDFGEKFGKCASCRRAHYCSKECQRKHWKDGHKQDCQKLVQK
ncbi:hypothetical protein Bbelb_374880 [Branchiostoma belcheri]|nr:hypothetical protein Bbelb_374880 [Branchiostoma belcheri]